MHACSPPVRPCAALALQPPRAVHSARARVWTDTPVAGAARHNNAKVLLTPHQSATATTSVPPAQPHPTRVLGAPRTTRMSRLAAVLAPVLVLLACLVQGADAECWARSCFEEDDCEDRDCEVMTARSKRTGASGVLQSCTGCKLHQLPSLRRWLREEQKFNEWENLSMEWIQGHNPDLVVVDSHGQEKERIDLTGYTYETMDTLLVQKGFARK